MSKLQDALSKLQRNRAAQQEQGAPPVPIARTVELLERPDTGPDGSRRRAHQYGGVKLAVDREALRLAGLMAPESQERRVADEYRSIKRPLIRKAADGEQGVERGNLLVVASALSGEGKTFSCINLCLSLATEKDWSVVLVDADVAKPHVSRLFGIEDRPGLLDLLRDHTLEFDALVCPTDVPGLAVMPSGERDELAAELLASARMESVCRTASEADSRRLIVFDSPPLLQTAEAPVLALHAGQIVMVVQADRTSQQQVLAALSKLHEQASISLVLNQMQGGVDYAYGGYYGYGYGRNQEQESA
jgi:protein-tyrosine kinase